MTDISAKDVKALRDSSGAGMMDAKKALTEAEGDPDAAAQILRERGLAKAGDRGDRENDQGAVSVVREGNVAALVEVKCETDFSAKSEGFVRFVDELAAAVLDGGTSAVDGLSGRLDDLKLTLKENIAVGEVSFVEAAEGNTLDTYLHLQDGRGVNAVIIEGNGVGDEDLHQVALHIAFAKPRFLARDEIPAEAAEAERASLLEITKAEGKPEQAWDKIVEGRLVAWYKDQVLVDQGLLGNKISVADSIGGGSIVRFVQAYIGSR